MTSPWRNLAGAVVRGVAARRLLSVGSVLMIALAIGSAILGPSFQRSVTNSYALARLDEAPAPATGISRIFTPTRDLAGEGVVAATQAAVDRVRPTDAGPWGTPVGQAESVRFSALRGLVTFWARDGACEHLDIEGRCPRRPGEVLMLAGDAEQADARIGRRLRITIFEPAGLDDSHPRAPFDEVVVTGTYQAPGAQPERDGYWYDPGRFASVPESQDLSGGYIPYTPAPLITVPETFSRLSADQWRVRVDRPLEVRSTLVPDDLAVAAEAVAAAEQRRRFPDGRLSSDNELNDLDAVVASVRAEQETARSSISPAVLSLVLVALALLLRLLTAASDLRRPELALASLRGLAARRLWVLGLAEPLLLVLVSVPVGVLTGVAASWALARWWLLPGLPVPFPVASLVAAGLVTVAAAAVAVTAVSGVLRETLAGQLAGVRRPDRPRGWALLGQVLLVAVVVVVLAGKLTTVDPGDPDVTDLVLPVLLAVVAGLAATRLVAFVAGWRAVRSRSGSISRYVSTRALARRREGTLVILPVTVAVAVSVFAAGVYSSAAEWRESVAATVSPADTVWRTTLPMGDAVDLTRRLDPSGEWVTPVATVLVPGSPFALVDGERFGRVATWPESWSPGREVADVVDAVTPDGDVPELDGRRVSLTLDNEARTSGPLVVELRFGTRAGRPLRRYLGPFPRGESTASSRLPDCGGPCRLEGLTAAGGAATMMTMRGPITVRGLEVDRRPVPGAFAGAGWTPNPDLEDSAVASLDVTEEGIRIEADSGGGPAMAKLTTLGLTRERPVQAGAGVTEQSISELGGTGQPQVRSVGTLEGMPFLGPSGLLMDYRSYILDRPVYDATFDVRVLARDGAPAEITDGLTDAGMTVETTFADEERVLGQGAYALALRLYAVVAALVLVMAMAGLVVTTAVQLPARRSDAAALRVVGVSRRAVMGAVARELVVVLGATCLAGILAGSLAQWIVLRTVRLGYVEGLSTPRLVAEVDPARLLLQGVVAAVVLGAAALVSAWLTVRGARAATLREAAR